MTQTEGEHELVLGNKQLLSAFFVVVILLGVFFTMGYFVGKNTATGGVIAATSITNGGPRADPAGRPVDPPAQQAASTPSPESTTPAPDPAPVVTTPAPPPTETKPAPPPESPAPKPETPERMPQPNSEEKYLQVSAVRRPDAENMVKVLKERGFPALLGESSKQGLYRVLVGPFKTTSELGHTKADLKAKGFESIVAK
jgi:cell division septation protein DedD